MRETRLTPAHAAFLQKTFARNQARFGGWTMDGSDDAAKKAAEEKAAAEKAEAEKAAAEAAAAAAGKFKAPESQDELDRIISARLAREREKYGDYDDLKKKAEAHDKAIEDAKTEHEKAVDAARAEGEASALERANVLLVAAKAETIAATAKFHDPEVAVKLIDLTGIKVENGVVDTDAVKAKLDALATEKPYLVDDGKSSTRRPDPSQGGGGTDAGASVSRGREMYASQHKKSS